MKSFLLLFLFIIVSLDLINAKPIANKQGSYDPWWSRDCVWLSGLAYCDQKYLQGWNCTHCKQDFPSFEHVTVLNDKYEDRGFIGYDHDFKRIIISYRGSSNLQNWITDLQMNTKQLPWGNHPSAKVHAGFLKAFEAMKSEIHASVSVALGKNPSYPVLVTGHSLGAALAVMTSVELTAQFPNAEIHTYNFGCPRVGNSDWAQLVSETLQVHYRVVHDADIVPHLPPKAFGYKHAPIEVFYPHHSTENKTQDVLDYRVCEPGSKACSDGILFPNAGDHSTYLGYNFDCNE